LVLIKCEDKSIFKEGKMRNKFLAISLILILMLAIVGCSSEAPADSAEAGDDTQQEATFDSSLEGMELLNSISGDRPKNMEVTMEITSLGMTSISKILYSGDNSRIETDVAGMGKSVQIYNATEEILYSYQENGANGVKMLGADSELVAESGLMMDFSSDFTDLSEDLPGDAIVRVEKLGDEEVVYLEATLEDDELGEMPVKLWYSVEFNLPLKYEMYTGEEIMMSLIVTAIEKNIKVNQNMFEEPSDISFQEVQMSEYMNDFM
jgi:outer membrane lipoprotein-sorting protein